MPSPAAVLAIQVDANTAQANAALMKTQAQLESTAAKSKAATDAMASQWKAAGAKMTTAGKSMTRYVTLPVVALGTAAVKMSIDFHKSMSLVQTQAGASAKEVDKMTQAILKFAASGKTSFGPNELAQGLYAIESAGLRGAKALQTLKQSSNLAMIGQTDLADTTKALTAAQKSGIKGTQNLKDAIGTLNATVGAGQMHMNDLLAAMGTGLLSSAHQLGLNLTDVGGALAELTKQGMSSTQSATRLRMSFSLMAAPSSTAATALKSIGLNTTDLAKAMRDPKQGLLGALQMLQQHLSGLSKVKQTQVLSAAFGGGRSSAAMLALLGNLKDLSKTTESIHQHMGKVNQDLKKAKETKSEELQIEWAKLQATMVELGDRLIPVVIPALQKLGDAAIRFIGAFSHAPNWVVDLMIGAIAIGPFLRIAGGLMKIAAAARAAAVGMGLLGTAEAGATGAGGGGALAGLAGGSAAGGLAVGGLAAAGGVGIFGALTSQGGLIDTLHGHATANLGSELGSQIMDGYRKGILDHINGPKKALDTVSNEIATATGGSLDTLVNGPVAASIKDLKSRFGDLVAAGHSMSEAQRQAWIHVAQAAEKNGDITFKQLQHLTSAFTDNTAAWRNQMQRAAKATGQTTQSIANSVGDAAVHVSKAYDGMVHVVGSGLNWLTSNTSKAAQALGVKQQIKFHTTPNHVQGTVGNQHVAGLQRGGHIVGGVGSGDKVPAMLEPGEFVLNREAVKGIGQARLEAMNKAIPRFATGGSVKLLPGVNMTQGSEPQILKDLGTFSALMKKVVYVISGYRSPAHSVAVGGFANDPHTRGEAADIGLGSPTLASMMSMGLDSPLKRSGLYRPFYPPSSAEANHVQLLAGAARAAGVSVPTLKRLILHGRQGALRLRDAGQASLDKVWNAGKHYLASIKPQVGRAAGVSGGGTFPASPGGWHRVGATYEGLDGQQGAYGTVGGMGFAELLLAGANAGMHPNLEDVLGKKIPPMGKVAFRMPGSNRMATAVKNDIGSGQPGNGHYLVDIQTGLAKAIGWHPNQDVLVKAMQRGGAVMPPYGGSFASGGQVPGPIGSPRTVVAHGGEMIGKPTVSVNLHFANGMEWLQEYVRAEASVEYDERAGLSRQTSRMQR